MQPNVVKDSVIIIACFKGGRGMRHAIPRFSSLAVSLGITGLFAIGYPAEVRAQTQTIFCPATFTGTGTQQQNLPVFLSNGSCTNGQDGAFSGAALASQALSELSQTTSFVLPDCHNDRRR